MSLLAFGTFFFGIVIRFSLDSEIIQANAEYVLTLFVILAAVNTLTHLFLTNELKHTTNFIFVLAVGGYLVPRNRIFYPLLGSVLLCWVAVVTTRVNGGDDVAHFGFEVLLGCLFALFLQMLRRGQLEQMGDLEQSIEQLNASQQQVIASEALLQSVMDNIPAGIVVRGADTRIRFVNKEAKNIFGIANLDPTGLPLGEDPFQLYDAAGRKLNIHEYPVSRVLATGEPITNEIVGGRGPGESEMVWGLLNAFPLEMESTGETVVVLAFTNITERVRAELLLSESETRARAILESVTEGVIAVDRQERVTLFNPAAQAMTGVEENNALGQHLASVFHFQSNLADEALIDPSIREGTLTSDSGEDFTVELLVSEVRIEGDSVGWVYSFRDVSEQHRVEQERATMDKMKSIGVLAGGIAHDFNNLLTAIYGNVALAESSMEEPEKAAEFLKRSSESIQLATNLTKQLLTFSTGSDPVRDVVDMEKLVRDAGQVQQAISNIVLNAKQAMGDVGQITISMVNTSDEFVEVQVRDEGPGIPADMLGKVFDPYFTTKSTGTGLGLATTHSVVTKHGGSISVESSEDGTVFRMTFPATASAVNDDERGTPERSSDQGLEVLVMDDEEIVLNTICRLLEHLGHKPTATRDGTEAISSYARKKQGGKAFDLAIMDLTVAGGMGGTVAAAEILEIDPNAKLVVSSGYSSGAEMARFRELGFCARLEKPFRAADLEKTINEVMS